MVAVCLPLTVLYCLYPVKCHRAQHPQLKISTSQTYFECSIESLWRLESFQNHCCRRLSFNYLVPEAEVEAPEPPGTKETPPCYDFIVDK